VVNVVAGRYDRCLKLLIFLLILLAYGRQSAEYVVRAVAKPLQTALLKPLQSTSPIYRKYIHRKICPGILATLT
jgi:hypothetical protein